jgi:MoaA/NifB/PqqE/SkfB family radical SAM enzyme
MNKDTTFCPLPWIHLATHPDGKATLCCISDHTNNASAARNFVDGNVKHLNLNTNTVSEIMNSDFYKQTRLEMLGDIQPKACTRCYTEESNGYQSKRIEESKKFKFSVEDAKLLTAIDGAIEPDLKFIELRLGNICNIKCRTCNPNSSSKWAGEYSKLQKELPFVTSYPQKIITDWVDSDDFWNDLLKSSKNLEVVYVNGGEPTLVEKHWVYLEKLIELGYNKNITLWYNINLTNLPDKLIELWKQFNKVQVFGSIDDLGERNSYIRTGTDWNTVEENLDKLKSNDWIDTSICQTVSWMNIYYLDEFYSYMESKNLKVHLNLVYDPKFFDPCVLPNDLKEIVLTKISKISLEKVNFLKNHLYSTAGSDDLFKKGIQFNKWLDEHRNQSFEKCFSDWNTCINNYYEEKFKN